MNKWWNYRFRIVWPEGQVPRWWIDILLIDVVVRPVLSELRGDIPFWRFHRRADRRDEKGHEFTFSCYIQDATAHKIHERFLSDQTVARLENENLLERYYNNIEDITDPTWPVEVQNSWPMFIMGVSDMLLELVAQVKSTMPNTDLSRPIDEIERYYSNLNDRISTIWQRYGSHAFFHHINALFGYEPVAARPRRVDGVLAVF